MFSLILTISLSSCFFSASPTYFENFSNELIKELQDEYELSIPKNNEFIGGYCDNAWRDPTTYLVFKVDTENTENMMSENWVSREPRSLSLAFKKFVNVIPVEEYFFTGRTFAIMQFSKTDDNNKTICCLRVLDSFTDI